jgi:hypothetical protein
VGEYADPTVVKQTTGITPDDLSNVADATELDALLLDLNKRVSEAIERYTDRTFEDHPNVTDSFDGNDRLNDDGNGVLRLPNTPVRSISEVEVTGTVLDPADYRLAKPGVGLIERKNAVFPRGWENVTVTYTWGYASPPGGVKRVAEDLIADALRAAHRDDDAGPAESVSIDGFSTSYFTSELENEQQHKNRLKKYRRIALA